MSYCPESTCNDCPLNQLPKSMSETARIHETMWDSSMVEYALARIGIATPGETAADIYHMFGAFDQQVNPVLRCAGRQALEQCPPTPTEVL